MPRQTDLENSIRESYSVICKYEDIIRTSDQPEEGTRAWHEVDKQWAIVEKYLAEYHSLVAVMPNDIALVAARFVATRGSQPAQNDAPRALSRKSFEPEMILIPAGEFWMGEKKTLRQEYLPAYYIAKTPITNIQYLAFVQAGGKCPKHWKGGRIPAGKELHPVIWVFWRDAVAYCNWLSQVAGKMYWLPTEHEWEKAARGTDGRKWPWGNKWRGGLCNTIESGINDTTPAGQYSPRGDSPYGCADMAGNVWEWTSSEHEDWKGSHVFRGGSWAYHRRGARCVVRLVGDPDLSSDFIGFRCCLSPVLPSGS